MSVIVPILLTVHILVCLLLVLVVLMQLPRSEGLGAAFGGGVTENIFGAQTTHVLAKFTVWLGVAFFVITLLLAIAYTHQATAKSAIQKSLINAPIPVATPGAAQPSPVADQPAPSAAQPTPSAAQPAPSAAQPAPSAAQPVPAQ